MLLEFVAKLSLPDTFQSWFSLTTLHIWMCLVRLRREGQEGRILKQTFVKLGHVVTSECSGIKLYITNFDLTGLRFRGDSNYRRIFNSRPNYLSGAVSSGTLAR
ncbi:Ubiquinol-cytochrome-c reductase complex assembly factor 1 [Sparganum proliferum]